ncbi:MAG: ATP-dependent DNA helicase RecG [Myxococcota bacterium]
METLAEILSALEKPLAFASHDNLRNLDRIKGLEKTIPSLAARGAASAADPEMREAFRELARTFDAFPALGQSGQRAAVRRGLDLLTRLKREGSGRKTAAGAGAGERDALREALGRPMTSFKGVRAKTAGKLARLGIHTAWDALWTLPRDYQERPPPGPIAGLRPGAIATIDATLVSAGRPFRTRSGLKIYEALFRDDSGAIRAVWYGYRPGGLAPGREVRLTGPVEFTRGRVQLRAPEVEPPDGGAGPEVRPVYPLTEGLGQRTLRAILLQAIEDLVPRLQDWIPEAITAPLSLPSLADAVRDTHLPGPDADAEALRRGKTRAQSRLAFEELFFLELDVSLRRMEHVRETAVRCQGSGDVERKLGDALPFSLTAAQARALREIQGDLGRPHPMHRLLQGDVGCGKTVVALLACARALDAGLQAAVMAPTEILAEQHLRTMAPLLRGAGVRGEILTSGTPARARGAVLRGLADGSVPLIIGTHALLEDDVRFHRLGLAVIDEQHRFGVAQRLQLRKKGAAGERPHMLVMTATPIPRSLALTVYGDLDLSVIDALPPGREPVETLHFTEAGRREVYELIRGEVSAGRQAFLVYPLVSESEKLDLRDASRMVESLRAEFSEFSVGLVHGQLKAAEKDAVMASFRRGDIEILVSTTVIEVGIDVPNATLMVVEHAERFGLSQLHQLRGRVGRGEGRARCVLLTPPLKAGSDGKKRMKTMVETGDGFRIAEADLAMRGPGEFLGARQHGLPDFRTANLLSRTRLIARAREAARAIVESDPALARPENRDLRTGLALFGHGRHGLLRAG